METNSLTPLGQPKRRLGFGARWSFRALTLVLGIGIALALSELGVRIYVPQVSVFAGKGMFMADPDLGFRLRPGTDGGRNQHGFQDREYALEKPPGTLRIAVLGDSFTFGVVSPEHVYPEVLERKLNSDESETPVEVINCGVPGYNTRQEIGLYWKAVKPFAPDLVILGLFLGGDIGENIRSHWFDVVDGELSRLETPPTTFDRLLSRSHLYRLARRLLIPTVRADERDPESPPKPLPEDWAESFLSVEGARIQVCLRKSTEEIAEGYRITKEEILRFADRLQEEKTKLLVLLIPDEVQVNPRLFDRVVERFSFRREDLDPDLPNRRFSEFFTQHEIPFVDVLDECRKQHSEAPVYVFGDTHWNERGNEIAGQALAEKVRGFLGTGTITLPR